jgi:hypothetical protein
MLAGVIGTKHNHGSTTNNEGSGGAVKDMDEMLSL